MRKRTKYVLGILVPIGIGCILGGITGYAIVSSLGCGPIHIHLYEVHKYQTANEVNYGKEEQEEEAVWDRI